MQGVEPPSLQGPCGHPNPVGYRHCGRCGQSLPRRLCACGFAAALHDAFCGGCGSALTGAVAVPPAAAGDLARHPMTVPPAALPGDSRLDLARLAQEALGAGTVDAAVAAARGMPERVGQEDVRRLFAKRKALR